MPQMIGGRRKRRKPQGPRPCLASCGTTIDPWKRLCDRCFAQLPFDRRKEIATARQAGLHQALPLYADAAQWLAEQRIKAAEGN